MREVEKDAMGGVYNTRDVLYFVDEVGCSGKSCFCKFCEFNGMAGVFSYGTSKDLLSEISLEPPKSTYIVDLTRAKPEENSFADLMHTLEQLKNGRIVNHKYRVKKRLQLPSLVLIFANEFPSEETINLLSKDR